MADVSLKNVCKIYPGDVKAVDDFNLEVKDQEFIVLVGPSGCGKSTTLRMIAGLEEISNGNISIADRVVNEVPPKDRDIAMVFQNYALYPHMTVYDNMAFGLKLKKLPKPEIEKRVSEAAEVLSITELLKRRPKALSGGQRQRVAVGRAIVRQPKVFLFDEPLSNLDAKMRVQMRVEISKLHQRLNATMIYVTHDQVEAMTMGDRIVVMKDGVIQQVADPITLYDKPVNKFVAGFIGTPPMNFLDGSVSETDGALRFKNDAVDIALPAAWKDKLAGADANKLVFGFRPEDVGSFQAEQLADAPRIKATVEVVEPMGSESYVYLKCGSGSFIARVEAHRKCTVGQELELPIMIDKAHIFDAVSENVLV
ncbi:MAG: multiple sugar transport system ATP-binding protein [Rhodothermales bacterium]|jgi:multiple sugar transport system ATP-binding protein